MIKIIFAVVLMYKYEHLLLSGAKHGLPTLLVSLRTCDGDHVCCGFDVET